jgi:predicted enzyme related to lactoylglutathione lyase
VEEAHVIKRVKFATLPVMDQQRALEFYTEKLGFKIFTDQPYREGWRWIELQIPGGETRLVFSAATGAPDPTTPALVFVADDVERTFQDLRGKGVEFTQPPQKAPWGMNALFKDTEGNLLVLGTA